MVVFFEGKRSIEHLGMYHCGVFDLNGTKDILSIKNKINLIA